MVHYVVVVALFPSWSSLLVLCLLTGRWHLNLPYGSVFHHSCFHFCLRLLHKVVNNTHPRSVSSSLTLHFSYQLYLLQPLTFYHMINPVLPFFDKHFLFSNRVEYLFISLPVDQLTFSILLYTHISNRQTLQACLSRRSS